MSDRQVFIVSAVRSPTGNYVCVDVDFAFEPVHFMNQGCKCVE